MISLNQLKKTRSSVAALSILIALQSLYAQSADAQVTFSSTVVSTTCALSFNAGVGATSATVTMANISTQTVNARSGAVGSVLAPPTRFTVGFTSGVGASTACTHIGSINVYFSKDADSTLVTSAPRTFVKTTTDTTTGVGIEIESLNGSTVVQKISDYTNVPTYTGTTLVSSQTGLASITTAQLGNPSTSTLAFQVTPVKTTASTSAVATGTIAIKVPVTISYL